MADSMAGGLHRCVYLRDFNGRGSQHHCTPYELEQVQWFGSSQMVCVNAGPQKHTLSFSTFVLMHLVLCKVARERGKRWGIHQMCRDSLTLTVAISLHPQKQQEPVSKSPTNIHPSLSPDRSQVQSVGCSCKHYTHTYTIVCTVLVRIAEHVAVVSVTVVEGKSGQCWLLYNHFMGSKPK